MWYATVAPGDMIWVPSGTVLLESVMDASDCVGIRFSMIMKRDVVNFLPFETKASNKMTPASDISKRVVEVAKTFAAPPAASSS